MKKHLYIISILALLLMSAFAYAGLPPGQYSEGNSPHEKEKASQWMKAQPVQFLENKGQMTDMEGKPVPFVLFKAEAPGMDMYITEKGLTYVFNKFHKEEIKEEEKTEADKAEEQLTGKKKKKKWMSWDRIDMQLGNATIKKENIIKETPSGTDFNYFFGHCPDGIYGVKQYEKITITDVYPGIDWVFYNSTDKGFKYDFIVHPGADPKQIELIYSSLNPLMLDKEGNIHITTELGTLTENAPYSYVKDTNREITTHFEIINQQNINRDRIKYYQTTVALKLSTFNFQLETLVIDPQLVWATFYGGNGFDGPMSVTTDTAGNVFVTGYTDLGNFPLQNWTGAYNQAVFGGFLFDAFILKFRVDGSLQWATYYGGDGLDFGGASIATDNAGNIFVTGSASGNFPLQNWAGAYNQAVLGGGFCDAFILKFRTDGSLQWATYYGGSDDDRGTSITTDKAGNVFITGRTRSVDFPFQNWAGAYNQAAFGGDWDVFILKFRADGSRQWATCYGGSGDDRGNSIAIDSTGNVFVTGYTSGNFPLQNLAGAYNQPVFGGGGSLSDAFILKFQADGSRQWATYYGGSSVDRGTSIAIDPAGNIFVMGYTSSTDFPLHNWVGAYNQAVFGGGQDAFILKFRADGFRQWATWYGGSGNEYSQFSESFDNIAIDDCGNIYISFDTGGNMPAHVSTCGAYDDNSFNGLGDQYITRFSSTGARVWDTYLGGNGYDFRSLIAVDKAGNLYVSGEWAGTSSGYPVTNPGGGAYYDGTFNGTEDGFMAKFIPIPPSYTQSQVNSTTCSPCNGSATINVSCGNPDYGYVWSNGSSTMNTTSPSNTISGLCPGTYTVTVTSNCNQTQTATYVITDNSLPVIASFEMMPPDFAPLSNPLILFIDQSTGADNWLWNFGDLLNSSSTLKDPSFTYADTGAYLVTQIVTNNEGCMDTAYQTIYIESEYSFYIPNAFTPDNDGVNDLFVPKGTGLEFIESFKMAIFNRWGEEIYHTTDINKPWDGKLKNKSKINKKEESGFMKQDVFVYTITVKVLNKPPRYYVGNVTMIK